MCIDPLRDIIVAAAHDPKSLIAINPKEPKAGITQLLSAGDRPAISEFAAIEYAANLDRLVYYSAKDGPQIYSITAPASAIWEQLVALPWHWHGILNQASNGLDPVEDAASHSAHEVNKHQTFGRFRVARYHQTDVGILVRHTDSPVYAIRLN
jgi:hypothetical protein